VRLAAVIVLAGCGRFGFDSRMTTSDGAPDTSRDTSSDTSIDSPADTAMVCGLSCDGFDSVSLGSQWMLDTAQGTVTLDSTHVHSGAAAAHMHVNAITSSITNPRAELVTYQGLPVTGTLYARAWMYFQSSVPPSPFAQMINFADTAGEGISMGSRNAVIANNDYTSTTYAESATGLPLDAWTCVMFEMPSGTTGTARVYLGGTELTDIALPVTTAQPAPDHLYLGLEWVGTLSSQPPVDIWVDDFAMDTAPLPCT